MRKVDGVDGRSQRDGVVEDVLGDARAEVFGGHDVDVVTEEVPEIHEQAAEVEQVSAWLQIDQEVDVTPFARFASSDGAEDADIGRAAPLGHRQDLVPALADLGQRRHPAETTTDDAQTCEVIRDVTGSASAS